MLDVSSLQMQILTIVSSLIFLVVRRYLFSMIIITGTSNGIINLIPPYKRQSHL